MASTSAEKPEDCIEVNELEMLLALAEEQEKEEAKSSSFSFLDAETNEKNKLSPSKLTKEELLLITPEIMDSSDEEESRNYLERKYNDFGRQINQTLKAKNHLEKESKIAREVNQSFQKNFSQKRLSNSFLKKFIEPEGELNLSNSKVLALPLQQKKTTEINLIESELNKSANNNKSNNKLTVYTDPIFGMRIINPLISSSVLTERMSGKRAVAFSSLPYHLQCGDLSKDWVIAGCILSKSPIKISKNGSAYSIWRLTDLKDDIKTISLFLFKSAHKELWKTANGMIVAILNPGVFEKRAERNEVACLSIDTSQKVMLLGQSKDMGICKAKKKNGEPCEAIVNLSQCDFCIFHIKQEYSKMSKRSELQSATSGRGLNELRNKVLGKNEVFYAGQSYTAIPAKRNIKQLKKDEQRLSSLLGNSKSPYLGMNNSNSKIKKEIPYAVNKGHCFKVANTLEINTKQKLLDLERLKLLNGDYKIEMKPPEKNTDNIIPSTQSNSLIPDQFKGKDFTFGKKPPTLSRESFSFEVDISAKNAELAKLNAIEKIKQKPIVKMNQNFIKYRGTVEGKKRAITELENISANVAKKIKLNEEEKERKSRIEQIINASSSHVNLIEAKELEKEENYFNKLEKKEAMEEKMLNTYKVPCKAVICYKCKYTAFSAADVCKQEKHPIKVIDAQKRFFQCKDCGNRTATVHKIPKLSCKNCHGSRWERAAMMKEKNFNLTSNLSIRGDEETFLGSTGSSVNLNLLVPET